MSGIMQFHNFEISFTFCFWNFLLELSVDFADVSCLWSLGKFWNLLTHLHYCVWRWSVGRFGQGLPVGCYVGRWVGLRAFGDVAESNVLPLKRIIPWFPACPVLCSLATLLTELSLFFSIIFIDYAYFVIKCLLVFYIYIVASAGTVEMCLPIVSIIFLLVFYFTVVNI